jgi:hypothetical protein
MNKYLEVLNYLKQYQGDGQLYNIEHLFGGISHDRMTIIVNDLVKQCYIQKESGSGSNTLPPTMAGVINRDGSISTFGTEKWHSEYAPFRARITFDGSDYLKKELEIKAIQSINISNLNNSPVILNSANSNINIDNPQKQSEIVNIVQKMIDTLQTDISVNNEVKQNHLASLEDLLSQAKNGKVEKGTAKDVLAIGDSISSISSFLFSLWQYFHPMFV